jgi:hypothetical protein
VSDSRGLGDVTGPADRQPRRTSLWGTALLGMVLALHFASRFESHRVTPLSVRHFYPTSYFVSLSLLAGRGFNYLLPADTSPAREAWTASVGPSATPPADSPAAAVVDFLRPTGRPGVTRDEFRRYVSQSASFPTDPWEATRIFDIYLTAALWGIFGITWDAYFVFYALVSTAANLLLFGIARRSTGSYWCGVAASFGLLVSPLERYSATWSVRDTAPLWFTALAFGTLAHCLAPERRRRPLVIGAATGVASLVGLGWRPDTQLLPVLVLSSLALVFAVERRPRRDFALAACGFALGGGVVLLSLGWLGPRATYDQGPVVFHTAWYGEASRSNVLQTENAFQIARDDNLTLYQANYFAQQRYGADERVIRRPNDAGHLRRVQAMYWELARFNAWTWWKAFPSFVVRCLDVDRPTVLGSVAEADSFYDSGTGPWGTCERSLEWYGALVPWLAGIGAVLGLLHPRTRVWTAIFGGLLLQDTVALMLVLPEQKHHATLLLPLHLLAVIGLWSMGQVAASWRLGEPRRLVRAMGGLRGPAVLAALLWLCVGAVARTLSVRRQHDVVLDLLRLAPGQEATGSIVDRKLFSVRVGADVRERPSGYLLKVRSKRETDLLCLHQRGRADGNAFLAYYTRHRILPGKDRLFFFNVVAGAAVGDNRPYSAWVRLLSPGELVAARRLDLSGWRFGLPLSLVLDDGDGSVESTFVGAEAPATDRLPSPETVAEFLRSPRGFLAPYPSFRHRVSKD